MPMFIFSIYARIKYNGVHPSIELSNCRICVDCA